MKFVRRLISVCGAVQGVGFRPFIYCLATAMKLNGRVFNTPAGITIDIEASQAVVNDFVSRIQNEHPVNAFIESLEVSFLDPVGFQSFEICDSTQDGETLSHVLPDISACVDCLTEVFNPADRRYLYPFTNCTNCGPRFTIIESLPYDRCRTTMKKFEMCSACRTEYLDPVDRRFHAQPNACPECGPHIELWNPDGSKIASREAAISKSVDVVRGGGILAVKGLGGFHLFVDATNQNAVKSLRARKHREAKPFALMFPNMECIHQHCEVSVSEERLLLSPQSPIVLLAKRKNSPLPDSIAPRSSCYGTMLPYTPLHHLLLKKLNIAVVATSGNVSDEPICIDAWEALARLSSIADCFLVHDRPIIRPVDDSIVRFIQGREMLLRRARGYAPLPIPVKLRNHSRVSTLAVGGHLKNTVAFHTDSNIFISQHVGDLETPETFDSFQKNIGGLKHLFRLKPVRIASDLHPDYMSTKYAVNSGIPQAVSVQHHYAHICSCMVENELEGTLLGIAWDGTGYGPDQTIWGGEFLQITETSYERLASFRLFSLPGGGAAIREPRRTALSLLYEVIGEELFDSPDLLDAFEGSELKIMKQILQKKINSPLTSSVGRLFDGVASLLGIRHVSTYEGQAAMELEFVMDDGESNLSYSFDISDDHSPWRIDWQSMIREILVDQKSAVSTKMIALKFHNTLVEAITEIAGRAGQERVVLSGGCFQNRYLIERAVTKLRAKGFKPYWHQHIPPNDGGLSAGQIYAALRSVPGS